jgi:hypothetical protein
LTLVLALRCREGAVLAADDQLTYRVARGRVARTTPVTKLMHTRGIAWGWGGHQDAQQRFATQMFEVERGFSSRDTRTTVQDRIEAAARTSQGKLESGAALELLVAWWSMQFRKPLILKVHALGPSVRSVFVDDLHNVEMVGSSEAVRLAEFALLTLGFGDFRDVGMEEGKTLAFKVIADVAARTDDVGRPSHIYGITEHGIEELDAQDIAATASSADVWTANLRATLSRERAPAQTSTPDTGVRPPE